MNAASIADLRAQARSRLPGMVFDYIDGAAGEETTARRNRKRFDRFQLLQEVLVDVSVRSLKSTLFGQNVSMPIVIGPTGLNGAFWPQGDLALAKAASHAGVPFVMSSAATVPLSKLTEAAGALRWFQLYMLKDRGLVQAFLERVHTHGFDVLQLTVDTAVPGRRNRDIRNGFTLPFRWTLGNFLDCVWHPRWSLGMLQAGMPTLQLFEDIAGKPPRGATISDVMQQQLSSAFTWSDLEWLRTHWKGKLVLKGVCSVEHLRMAVATGMDGVVVSNHGGRQLDGTRSSIESLPAVVEAGAGRLTVLIDSGFRCGADIAKALALGADAVQLGRPTLYGLAASGQAGVSLALQILAQELDRAMALCGATQISELRGRVESVD